MYRIATLALLCVVPLALGADSWPRFRGPNGEGRGSIDIPAKWENKHVAWKVKLPGQGHSSPVVYGGRVFVTSSGRSDGKRIVLCLDAASGKVLWKDEQVANRYKMHRANSIATSTPALDGERLYVYWATPAGGDVLAYSHAGKQLWRAPLPPYRSQHGPGVSLVVHEKTVLVHHQPDGDGQLIGLDAATGKKRWSLPRVGAKNATYSAPCIRTGPGGKAEAVITNWQLGITAVDVETGKLTWTKSVFDTADRQRCIPSPVLAGDLVLGVCGFAGGARRLVALRPGSSPEVAWKLESAVGQMATPLYLNGRVLVCNEVGMVSWVDAKDGRVIWKKRVGGTYHASPVAAGGRIYLPSKEGKMRVLAASDTYKLLAENDIGGPTQATPALCGGRMFVRTEGHLMCLAPPGPR